VTAFVLTLVLIAGSEDDFYAAMALERDGDAAAAAAALRRVADGTDAFADDALAELARLYEEQLGEPVKALAAWDEILRRFPDSRMATRADKRAAALRESLGPGNASAAAVAEWQRILHAFGTVPHAESVAHADALVRDHPDFPAAAQAAFWAGTVVELDGDLAGAEARWRAVADRWPTSDAARRAERRIGDLLLDRGDLDGAEVAYRAAGGDAGAKLAAARWRARAVVLAWIVLVALAAGAIVDARRLAGTWRGAGAALARPPSEALYLLPVAIGLVAAGYSENWAIAHALAFMCAGGLALAWLSGALLEAARRNGGLRGARVAAHIAAAVVAVGAICYLAVTRERLVDMLIETIRFGAER
jgi:hypothetical protein